VSDRRLRRFLSIGAALATVITLVWSDQAGSGTVSPVPSGDATDPGDAVQTVGDLAKMEDVDKHSADRWIGDLGNGVRDELGYSPVVDAGYPANPEGRCSSPVPLPQDFEPACRTHDLGYDLLRIADSRGQEIPDWIRPALDRQLVHRMNESCSGDVAELIWCSVLAAGVSVVLGVNTWRQHNGAPVHEDLPWPTPG
jgi:hypothetical protein